MHVCIHTQPLTLCECNTYTSTHTQTLINLVCVLQRGLSLSQEMRDSEENVTTLDCSGMPSVDRCCVSVVAGDAVIESCKITSQRGYGVMVWGQAQPTFAGMR